MWVERERGERVRKRLRRNEAQYSKVKATLQTGAGEHIGTTDKKTEGARRRHVVDDVWCTSFAILKRGGKDGKKKELQKQYIYIYIYI